MARHGLGRRIERVEVRDPRSVRNATPSRFTESLTGRRFQRVDRQGKWLLATTDGPTVLMHFGMTGGLLWAPNQTPAHRFDRVVFALDGGELRFRDMRKLQGIWLADDAEDVAHLLGRQGPDALTIGQAEFADRLRRRRGRLKPVLMNQRVVAGLGNLLVDEILWQAHLHPERRTDSLSGAQVARIYRVMRHVLRQSNRVGYVPAKRGWLTGARADRGDAVCPRCGAHLRHKSIGGRTTYWCPREQRLPSG